MLVPSATSAAGSGGSLKIGVVLSGGQAPGGHNVICGLFGKPSSFLPLVGLHFYLLINGKPFLEKKKKTSDYLEQRTKGSTLYGFRGGPAGIMNSRYIFLTSDFVRPYRNQVRMICSWLAMKMSYFLHIINQLE